MKFQNNKKIIKFVSKNMKKLLLIEKRKKAKRLKLKKME